MRAKIKQKRAHAKPSFSVLKREKIRLLRPKTEYRSQKTYYFVFLFELSREKFFSARYAPIFFMNSSRSIMPIARAAIFSLYLSMNSEAR